MGAGKLPSWSLRRAMLRLSLVFLLFGLAACSSFRLPSIPTGTETGEKATFSQVGIASWYGKAHHGRKTASGERFNMREMTAAHRTLPFDTVVRVTNLETGKVIKVRINDRGPYVSGRIIDLSAKAAAALEIAEDGTARVRIEEFASDQP